MNDGRVVRLPFQSFATVPLATLDRAGYLACDIELRMPARLLTADTFERFRTTGTQLSQVLTCPGADDLARIAQRRGAFVDCGRPYQPSSGNLLA